MDYPVPRRNRLDQNTPAELAIRAASDAVEALAADPRLTEAVVLLGRARECVADYVDGVGPVVSAPPSATTSTPVGRPTPNPDDARGGVLSLGMRFDHTCPVGNTTSWAGVCPACTLLAGRDVQAMDLQRDLEQERGRVARAIASPGLSDEKFHDFAVLSALTGIASRDETKFPTALQNAQLAHDLADSALTIRRGRRSRKEETR